LEILDKGCGAEKLFEETLLAEHFPFLVKDLEM
jgi:hypothetical protein